jgi:hypothetical protein
MNVWADVHFGDVRTLSGPRLPAEITTTVGFHADPRRNITALVAVRTGRDGKRTGWRLAFIPPTESEACFEIERAKALNVVVPKAAVRRGDKYCISVI